MFDYLIHHSWLKSMNRKEYEDTFVMSDMLCKNKFKLGDTKALVKGSGPAECFLTRPSCSKAPQRIVTNVDTGLSQTEYTQPWMVK